VRAWGMKGAPTEGLTNQVSPQVYRAASTGPACGALASPISTVR
jgi:hypothetical protein